MEEDLVSEIFIKLHSGLVGAIFHPRFAPYSMHTSFSTVHTLALSGDNVVILRCSIRVPNNVKGI